MRTTTTLLLLLISIASKAQIAVSPSIHKPDSVIYYGDIEETERYMIMKNIFEGDSIDIAAYWYDNDTVNFATKNVYYMDKSLPLLPFEPLFSGGRSGSGSGYSYVYTSTIGDTLSKSYNYDFGSGRWVKESITKHNISEEGIDTLVTTHTWNETSTSWELNNVTKQQYIKGETDTLKVLMLAPNLEDTINYDVFSYEYNLDDKKTIVRQTTPGVIHFSIDSFTYNASGLIDYNYYGNNNDCANAQLPDCDKKYVYDYAEQYFYDDNNRLDKIYFWNKQDGLSDWEFDGCFKYYYSAQSTSRQELRNKDSYKLYPNPCADILTIEKFTGKIEVYSSMGQLMLTKQMENGGQINTSVLPKGIYVVKFENSFSRLITKQ